MDGQKEESEKLLLPEFNHGKDSYLLKYKGYILMTRHDPILKDIPLFEVRAEDIWVVAFPKSGITWMQEIVYLVMNNADVEKASKTKIDTRYPFFENLSSLEPVTRIPSPRFIKSHLPLSLLPNGVKDKKPKIIYVMRNPKDIVNSYFTFLVNFLSTVPFTGSYEDFCRLFVEDKVLYGPWWKHVCEAWEKKDDSNILVLFYEDLHMNFKQQVWKIATFLEKQLTEEQVETILRHCSFESMRNNSMVNYDWLKAKNMANKDVDFLRKGKVGDWKYYLSDDIVRKLDEMVATKIPHEIPLKDSLPETNASRL